MKTTPATPLAPTACTTTDVTTPVSVSTPASAKPANLTATAPASPVPSGTKPAAAVTTVRDLSKQAPHSPRNRLAGFVVAKRTVDKCRASLAGSLGEYHYDCPLDNVLFAFKGITGAQFAAAVRMAKNNEEIGAWLIANGTPKTPAEIKAWSDQVEASRLSDDPAKSAYFEAACTKLGLDPKKATTFDWLEADDRASFGKSASRPH